VQRTKKWDRRNMEQNKNKLKEEIEDNLEVNLNQTVEERWGQLKKAIKETAINKVSKATMHQGNRGLRTK